MAPSRRIAHFLFASILTFFFGSDNVRADLVIYHFNVEMGDSTLIVDTVSGKSLLVDAGNRGIGKRLVAPALNALGITKITYFIATHYDSDHIGGFDELDSVGITITDAVFDRGDHTDRKLKTPTGRDTQYGEYLKSAKKFGRKLLQPSCASEINLGGATRVQVVASGGKYLVKDCTVKDRNVAKSKDNDLSVAIVVRHGEFSYFIGGDLTGGGNSTAPMEDLVAPIVGDVDVLKINHHGSLTSSSKKFLQTLSPEVAIISVGNGGVNKTYRLPRQAILDRLAELTSTPLVFLTNRGEGGTLDAAFIETGHSVPQKNGSRFVNRHILVHTNGKSYSINGVVRSVDERLPHNTE